MQYPQFAWLTLVIRCMDRPYIHNTYSCSIIKTAHIFSMHGRVVYRSSDVSKNCWQTAELNTYREIRKRAQTFFLSCLRVQSSMTSYDVMPMPTASASERSEFMNPESACRCCWPYKLDSRTEQCQYRRKINFTYFFHTLNLNIFIFIKVYYHSKGTSAAACFTKAVKRTDEV